MINSTSTDNNNNTRSVSYYLLRFDVKLFVLRNKKENLELLLFFFRSSRASVFNPFLKGRVCVELRKRNNFYLHFFFHI